MLQILRLIKAEGSKEGSQVFRLGLRLVKAEVSKEDLQVLRISAVGSETSKG